MLLLFFWIQCNFPFNFILLLCTFLSNHMFVQLWKTWVIVNYIDSYICLLSDSFALDNWTLDYWFLLSTLKSTFSLDICKIVRIFFWLKIQGFSKNITTLFTCLIAFVRPLFCCFDHPWFQRFLHRLLIIDFL